MIPRDRWRPAAGLELEPNALRAVTAATGNLAITAGPGAGKTELLAQRADFLLRTGTCRLPRRILAISFKVDASRNLRARVRLRCGAELAARFDSYTFHAFAKKIIDRFRLSLTGTDALDADYSIGPRRVQNQSITFADLVPLAIKIVTTNAIARKAIRSAYSHVFLDEFQDCTSEQYQLISICFRDSSAFLTAVGDTKQRIMGWAGALEGIFTRYAKDFAALPLNLYQNFRSKPRLRRVQNAMVRTMDAPAALADADLAGDEGLIHFIEASDTIEEAEAIADWIDDLITAQGTDPAQISILVSRDQAYFCQDLRLALDAKSIRYRDEDKSQNIASEPVAVLIADFLLVAGSSSSPSSYRRLMDLVVFGQALDDEGEHRAWSRWERFIQQIRTETLANARFDENRLRGIVDRLIEAVGRDVVVGLSADYSYGNNLELRLDEVILALVDMFANDTSVERALATFAADRAVRIMSIHKSKGLEFDTVIVLGVETETFWGNANTERSAFFVAISRAKVRLALTFIEERRRPDNFPGHRPWQVKRSPHAEFLGYAQPYA